MNRQKQEKRAAQAKAEAAIKCMTKDLNSLDRNGDIKNAQTQLTKFIETGNGLYPTIRKRLPGSAADATFLKTLLRVGYDFAKRLNSTVKSFSLKEKLVYLKRLHQENLEEVISQMASTRCLCHAPTFEYFYGAIKLDGMILRQPQKRSRMQLDDPAKGLVKATERNIETECEQDSTPKEVEAIHFKIKRLIKSKPSGVKFLSATIDTQSFPKTVENLFHTAFLVKDSKVSLTKGNREGDTTILKLNNHEVKPKKRLCKQAILSFNKSDYERWVRSL